MNKWMSGVFLGLSVLACVTVVQGAPDPYQLVWSSPGKGPKDSMPIGNGDIGANVWVEQNGDLVFYISKTDVWSENCRLLKLGKVRVTLDPPLYAPGTVFEHCLDLTNGVMTISSQSPNSEPRTQEFKLTFWIDANNPVIRIEGESSVPCHAVVSFEPWRTGRRQLKGQEAHSAYGLHGAGAPSIFVEPDVVLSNRSDSIAWYHRNERSIWRDNLNLQGLGDCVAEQVDPLHHRTFGALIEGDGLVSTSSTSLTSEAPAKQLSIRIHALTAITDTAEQWISAVEEIALGGEDGRAERFVAHKRWWNSFWARSYIHITGDADAERVTQAYALQRWVNACSGRGGSPIKFNGSIFTVDDSDRGQGPFDADYRRWGGPYWWQNTRLPYWSMLSSGDADLMQPLWRMYRQSLALRKAATERYYGHAGAFCPETQYFWGTYVDGNYGRDRSSLPLGTTDNRYIRYYWQSGLELSLMMLDHYQHTQDDGFAEETLLPISSAIVTFYDQHWKRDDNGKIRFDPAMALETYRVAVNPLVEIVGIRKVCEELLRLPESLTTSEQRAQWTRLPTELPPVPAREVNGEKVLACAESYSGKQNTENPELYAVFPYRRYGVGEPDLELARRTYAHRAIKRTGGWSQDAIKAACLGLTDQARGYVVKNAKSKAGGYRFPAMWGPNFDWTPDQCHGSVMMIALQRMLLQTDGDEIRLLPAWPKHWNCAFKLHAPQQTVVEGVVEEGRFTALTVTPSTRKGDALMARQLGT